MGLLDGLIGGLAGGAGGADSSNLIGSLLGAATGGGGQAGLSGVLEQMAANGLADHVASWVGNGQNLPVSTDQIKDALGSDQVKQMAEASGLPVGDFLQHLADHLPAAAAAQAGDAQS